MKSYLLSEETITRNLRQLWTTVGVVLGGLVLLTALFVIVNTETLELDGKFFFSLACTAVTLMIGTGVLAAIIAGQMRGQLSAVQIELGDDRIIRPGYGRGVPRVEIRRSEVTAIDEEANGLWVRASSPRRAIFAASGLKEYGELKSSLSLWIKIEDVK